MNVLINIPKSRYKEIVSGIFDADGYFKTNLTLAFRNGTPIPDNATNGDIIKAMFDVKEIDMSHTYCVHFPEEEDYSHYFFKEWWNAPYQKGGKE